MQVIERTFFEFLRQPKEVTADLAQHDVVLRRRNAPDHYLSLAARDTSRAKTIECLARLLCKIAADSPEAMEDAIENAFPGSNSSPPMAVASFLPRLSIDASL